MPIFAVSGQAVKHDGWGITSCVMHPPAIYSASSVAEAIGNMLISLEKQYPSKDGWRYVADAFNIPIDWLTSALAYEKNRGH